jgi:hypothetical protein
VVPFTLVPVRQEPQRGLVGRPGFRGVDDEDLIGIARRPVVRQHIEPSAKHKAGDHTWSKSSSSRSVEVDVNEIIVRPAASAH